MKPELMDTTWYKELEPLFLNGTMTTIRKSLNNICPESPKNIFRAFLMPLQEVNICILGLSPYPNKNDAKGIAFAVEEDRDYNYWPYSLKIINDAIANDYADISIMLKPDLSNWTSQGVLLLNSALTCEVGQPLSHVDIWKPFTQKVIEILDQNRIIFYLLGSEAKSYKSIIKYSKVFESIHPAACAYNNVKFDSKFKEVADYYYNINKDSIVLTQ